VAELNDRYGKRFRPRSCHWIVLAQFDQPLQRVRGIAQTGPMHWSDFSTICFSSEEDLETEDDNQRKPLVLHGDMVLSCSGNSHQAELVFDFEAASTPLGVRGLLAPQTTRAADPQASLQDPRGRGSGIDLPGFVKQNADRLRQKPASPEDRVGAEQNRCPPLPRSHLDQSLAGLQGSIGQSMAPRPCGGAGGLHDSAAQEIWGPSRTNPMGRPSPGRWLSSGFSVSFPPGLQGGQFRSVMVAGRIAGESIQQRKPLTLARIPPCIRSFMCTASAAGNRGTPSRPWKAHHDAAGGPALQLEPAAPAGRH